MRHLTVSIVLEYSMRKLCISCTPCGYGFIVTNKLLTSGDHNKHKEKH